MFLATMQRHRGGKDLADLSLRLSEVTAAVINTGKAGTVTLTVSVKPAKRGQSAVMVETKLAAKVPSMEPDASFWFGTADGVLQKEDPRQTTMFGSTERPMIDVGGASETRLQPAVAPVVAATVGGR